MTAQPVVNRPSRWKKFWRYMGRNWQLYMLFIPVIVYFVLFYYMPMFGIQIAFKKYSFRKGI